MHNIGVSHDCAFPKEGENYKVISNDRWKIRHPIPFNLKKKWKKSARYNGFTDCP